MPIIAGASGTLDLFQDIGGLGGPDEGFRFLVVLFDAVFDGDDQVFGTVKGAAAQPVLCEITEKAFHHVQT